MGALSGATWRVGVLTEETTAIWEPPTADDIGAVFVCAHGAGGHMGDRSMNAIAAALRARGVGVVRFNFLYREKHVARPDAMPRLVACTNAVAEHARREIAPRHLLLGGRSMGGRAASVAVSEGAVCDGLVLLAYPLHPPGHPEKLRVAHLAAIERPVLCINGTRDTFCEPHLMEQARAALGGNWRMHWLDGADHGFHVLKKSGRTDSDVAAEAAETCRSWLDGML